MGSSKVKNRVPSRFNTPIDATLKCMGVNSPLSLPSGLFGGEENAVFKLIDFDYTPANKEEEGSKTEFNLAFELTLPEGYRKIPNTQIGMGKIYA